MGSFVGVGITYDIINDTVLVLSVVKEGPSFKAGILPGDRIVKVENDDITGTNINDEKLKDLLTGERGTEVTVYIKRKKIKKLKKFVITRGDIPVKSIDAAYLPDDDIVYIKLNRFSANTVDEFKEATDTLMSTGNKSLILDLRNNSGGYLYVAVKLLEFFLDKNSIVLTTKGVHRPDKEYKTQRSGKYRNVDLVILVNEGSASASEIVAGAIQDWDRGVIIGRRSFGKGLVQKPVYLVDGSMIRLTIAKYYTPSGRNIQKPYIEGIDVYNDEIKDRLVTGELMHKDSIKYNDSLRYYTLTNRRIIFGGGGIMPDIFIPADTMKFPGFYKEKINNGKINEFIHVYIDKNRDFLNSLYKDFNSFAAHFQITEEEIYELTEYLFDKSELFDEYARTLSQHDLVALHLKALMANDLWGESEYYQIYNMKDEFYLKAVDVLRNSKKYSDILLNDIVGDYPD